MSEQFLFNNQNEQIAFVETMKVTNGVECDVYTYPNDPTKDLAIIHIQPGCKTPLQKVLSGEKTIEGHISGKGKLIITRNDGKTETHEFGDTPDNHPTITVLVGDVMQWQADADSILDAFEICYPPYVDGRYENIDEAKA